MSLTFYYSPMSTASVTEIVLEELGVPVEKVLIDVRKGETKKPEFLAINPNGKVPCLVHDGTALWESAALTIYLGETFGTERNLWPAAGVARGEAMMWVVWTNVSLGEAVNRFTRNTMDWYPADQKNEVAGAAAKQDVLNLLKILDTKLAGKEFLVGDIYSLADTHLHSICGWIRSMKFDLSSFASLNAWSARCEDRPAYKKVSAGGAA